MQRVAIETEPEFNAGQVETLPVPSGYLLQPFERPFDISPDGERFLMIKEGDMADPDALAGLTQLIVVQNWFEEVKARVPTDD